MRISKYFSQQRISSRREAEEYVRQGRVKVNGEVVTDLGRQIDPDKDDIQLIGKVDEKTTILFSKPRGVSTPDIFGLIPEYKHLNAIGRLDKESEGLILLSNDGTLTNILTGKDHLIEKEYVVEVREKISQTQMNALSKGMHLSDGLTMPTTAKIINDHTFSIILKEGRNHQIRRMANQVRLTVTRLTRVRIGHLANDDLTEGELRTITKEDIKKFKKAAAKYFLT